LPEELVLVVPRVHLFTSSSPAWHGLQSVDYRLYEQLFLQYQEFLPRARMETDSRYKQIIPYLVFTHEDRYFVMQRRETATEKRLQGKMSIGIGGHINPQDLAQRSIAEWGKREFEEEVSFNGTYDIRPLGLLNDDSNEVGKVHIGIVFLLTGNSADIQIKEELKTGSLMTIEECMSHYAQMESWSQIVLDFLIQNA
jgi:predicted NUDIX family phosphoesterase